MAFIASGYLLIDLGGEDFTLGTAATVAGVWDKIEVNFYKPIYLTNFAIAGVKQTNTPATFAIGETTATATIGTKLTSGDGTTALTVTTITVTDTDSVTISATTTGAITD